MNSLWEVLKKKTKKRTDGQTKWNHCTPLIFFAQCIIRIHIFLLIHTITRKTALQIKTQLHCNSGGVKELHDYTLVLQSPTCVQFITVQVQDQFLIFVTIHSTPNNGLHVWSVQRTQIIVGHSLVYYFYWKYWKG